MIFLFNFHRKNVIDEVDFCMQMNVKVSKTLDIKVSFKVLLLLLMGMTKHSQSTQNNNFTISLQYLRKKVWRELLFCSIVMQKHSDVLRRTSHVHCYLLLMFCTKEVFFVPMLVILETIINIVSHLRSVFSL